MVDEVRAAAVDSDHEAAHITERELRLRALTRHRARRAQPGRAGGGRARDRGHQLQAVDLVTRTLMNPDAFGVLCDIGTLLGLPPEATTEQLIAGVRAAVLDQARLGSPTLTSDDGVITMPVRAYEERLTRALESTGGDEHRWTEWAHELLGDAGRDLTNRGLRAALAELVLARKVEVPS